MPNIGQNFDQLAEEYSDVPDSIRSLHENMGDFVQAVESNFVGTGVEGAEETVESHYEFERALEQFDTEITYLMEILRGNTTPDSVGEIEEIEIACKRLSAAAEQFQSDCFRLASSLSQAGITEPAEHIQTLAGHLGAIETSVNDSFLDNQLLIAVKAYHFPSSIIADIPEVIEALNAEDLERRQNSYGVLAMTAEEEPAAVTPYATQIADNLSTASPGEQQNLLGVLNVLQSEGETLDRDVRSDALALVDSADPTVALYASLLLAKQATTAPQARAITTRIESLLTQDIGTGEWTNATFVLYELAQSHPEAVEHVTPTMADFLTVESPSVQENIVEFLGEVGAAEYREDIKAVRANTTNDDVISAADTALEKLPGETEAQHEDSSREIQSDEDESIIEEIEDAFEEL